MFFSLKKINFLNFDFLWRFLFVFLVPELIFPCCLFADSTVDSIMQGFLDYFTGTIAKLIATAAIIGLGVGCFLMGKISKTAFFTTFTGIALMFGAKALMDLIAVKGA